MTPGWRWDRKSRISWRVVWRFTYCRSDSPALRATVWDRETFGPKNHFIHVLFGCLCVQQGLLKRPEVAVLVNMRLENTSWTASRISRFLSTPSADTPRNPGPPSTWLDIFNDLSHTVTTLTQVTEVHSCFPFMLLSQHLRFYSLLLRTNWERITFDEIRRRRLIFKMHNLVKK